MSPSWIPVDSRRPVEADADQRGDVLFLRSGEEILGRVKSGVPVDATHWRPLDPITAYYHDRRPRV